jgi:hypothetical protein
MYGMPVPTMTREEAIRQYSRHTNTIMNRKRGKLTPAQRWEIQQRRWKGEDPKDLSLEFGVTASYIRNLAPLS